MNGDIDYQLIKTVSDRISGKFTFNFVSAGVSTDSNRIKQGIIYAPIIDGGFDGHQLIETAIENGAVGSFWQNGIELPTTLPESFPIFYVDNVHLALERMADEYLFNVDPTTIVVLGDYSRVATKKILKKVLDQSFVVYEGGSSVTVLHVLETILSMPSNTDVLIMDVPSTKTSHVSRISEIVKPSLAIISENTGGNTQAISIVEGMKATGTVVMDGDRPIAEGEWKTDVMTIGYEDSNIFSIKSVQTKEDSLRFQMEGILIDFIIPIYLSNHLKCVVPSIAAGLHLGIGADQIAHSLKDLTMEDLGLDVKGNAPGSIVVFDHEKVEHSDVEYSINMVKYLHSFENRVVIVDEGFQSTPLDITLHEIFASKLADPITHVITIGEKAFWVTEALNRLTNDTLITRHFPNHAKTVDMLKELINSSSLILYRGANRALLEQIITELNRG
ncbi:hypothetical protein [Salipaludibacillus sp. CF4.18]|uniref:hypothetical protein n=1 Tax=Salipaludibacillus sp. CF4.18 TaxID=3373081 RepID=UPI003EE4781C